MRIRNKLTLLALSMLTMSAYAGSQPKDLSKLKIYISASLFNERETRFNLDLAESLEQRGYQVILPQRDGFEYKALGAAISQKLSAGAVRTAAANTIYLLNMGKLIPESDVVVANLDEPIDEGVVVEITYAHMIGKPVIGVRTDLRSPYNTDTSLFGGLHSFVAYQCNAIVNQHQQIRSDKDSANSMNMLTAAITAKFAALQFGQAGALPSYAMSNPVVANMVDGANILFSGVTDIHSKQGVNEVVKRLLDNQAKLAAPNFGLKYA